MGTPLTPSLPIMIGASTDAARSRDSVRADHITTDKKTPAQAAPVVEPDTPQVAVMSRTEEPEDLPERPTVSAVLGGDADAVLDAAERQHMDEIDALHARFDRMESLLKRRLGVATLDARFDNLEKWLVDRFGA